MQNEGGKQNRFWAFGKKEKEKIPAKQTIV